MARWESIQRRVSELREQTAQRERHAALSRLVSRAEPLAGEHELRAELQQLTELRDQLRANSGDQLADELNDKINTFEQCLYPILKYYLY